MAVLFLGTRFQSFKNDGTVNAGGTVYFYDTGTSTAKTTYSDSALTVANANPVVLNSAGAADIWYSGNADVTVKDSTGTTLDTFTSINPSTTTTTTAPNIITNGSFEELAGTEPSGWTQTLYTGGTGAQDADSIHGDYAWKFTSVGNGGGYITTNSAFLVAYNRPILLYWDMKGTADVRNVVDVLWYDDTDALLSTTTAYDNSTTNPTSYTRKYYTATPPSNAVTAKVRLYGCHSSDSTSGNTFYDNLYIVDAGFLGAPLTFSNAVTFSSIVYEAKGADVASAAALTLGTDGNYFDITGTTTITSIGTLGVGTVVKLHFDAALTLTHHATDLILPGGANIITAAGDEATFIEYASGDWRCTDYSRASDAEFTIASAATTDLGATSSENVYISGTTTITAFGTVAAGVKRNLRFADALTLTYNATSLILPGSANITTVANDTATLLSLGAGNWICTAYEAFGTNPSGHIVGDTSTSTSGAANYDFTIPAWAQKITIAFHDVGISTANDIAIRLGDNGGVETSGYTDQWTKITTAGVTAGGGGGLYGELVTTANTTAGIGYWGHAFLSLIQGSNEWLCTATLVEDTTGSVYISSFNKATSAKTTTLRIMASGGTFDSGRVRVFYA